MPPPLPPPHLRASVVGRSLWDQAQEARRYTRQQQSDIYTGGNADTGSLFPPDMGSMGPGSGPGSLGSLAPISEAERNRSRILGLIEKAPWQDTGSLQGWVASDEVMSKIGSPEIVSDVYNGPWKGPGELANYSGETIETRMAARRLFASHPVLNAAIEGKTAAIATSDPSVSAYDRKQKNDRLAAELCLWSVKRSGLGWENQVGGFPGLLRAISLPSFIDGWSAVQPHWDSVYHPELGWVQVPIYFRSLDTHYLRLRLDRFRVTTGIYNLRRGAELYPADSALITTHNGWYSDPFGQSDGWAVYKTACLITDTYKLWAIALQLYSMPYWHGKVNNPANRQLLEKALSVARARGWIVTSKEDEVDLLNLASATGTDAFKEKIQQLREDVFLKVRGAYTPFMQGDGKGDVHHDTKVSKGSSDAITEFAADNATRTITRLFKQITELNLPPGTGIPETKLGGINWEEVGKIGTTVKELREQKISVSAIWLAGVTGVQPAESPEDEVGYDPAAGGQQVQQVGPDGQPIAPQPGATATGGANGSSGVVPGGSSGGGMDLAGTAATPQGGSATTPTSQPSGSSSQPGGTPPAPVNPTDSSVSDTGAASPGGMGADAAAVLASASPEEIAEAWKVLMAE